jgi:XTP/dITP diphosphohydrolase
MARPRLVIASNNPGKVTELSRLLGDCGWEIVAPSDIGIAIEVEETGTTYTENARLKAEAFAKASGLSALSDDSGLEVDGLNGEPGPLHHVKGWDGRDQAERIAILLRAMRGLAEYQRSARFRAVIVLAFPDGRVYESEGVCEGMITEQPAGDGGFGYDPVFFLPEQGMTMAQLTPAQKNVISHRGRAADEMRGVLRALAAGSSNP